MAVADRYGRTRPRIPARWRYTVGLVILAVVLGAFAVFTYRNVATQPIETEQTGFTVIDDHTVRIEFTVRRDEPKRPVDCIVRARSAAGSETGRREVYVAPGPDTTARAAPLRTGEEAVTGEVYGCTYDIPPYLSPGAPPSG